MIACNYGGCYNFEVWIDDWLILSFKIIDFFFIVIEYFYLFIMIWFFLDYLFEKAIWEIYVKWF
jgi:hypothetical protein